MKRKKKKKSKFKFIEDKDTSLWITPLPGNGTSEKFE